MKTRSVRMVQWACLLTTCVFQGCAIDPDIQLRAAVSLGSDIAIFLLDNLAVAI